MILSEGQLWAVIGFLATLAFGLTLKISGLSHTLDLVKKEAASLRLRLEKADEKIEQNPPDGSPIFVHAEPHQKLDDIQERMLLAMALNATSASSDDFAEALNISPALSLRHLEHLLSLGFCKDSLSLDGRHWYCSERGREHLFSRGLL